MLDIKLVRSDPELIREVVRKRKSAVDIDELLKVDADFRSTTAEADRLRHEQKQLSGPEVRDKARELKRQLGILKETISGLEKQREALLSQLPNLIAPDTPDGDTDAGNVEIRTWGIRPRFLFSPKTHEEVGLRLGILDVARGSHVAGSGFHFWRGGGAKLVRAVTNLALDMLDEQGFVQMIPPILARERTLYGTGYLPFFADQIYRVEGTDLCLVGTSEQVLVGYHADEIIGADELPRLYTALTPCFRTEAGAYGKESHGIFRVHQFYKVEQIVFCRPQESEEWLSRCQTNAQRLMEVLQIPYRVVRTCVGDLGAPAYKKYDIEAWFTGFNAYRETHSNSNLLDFQTRRLNIRCKEKEGMFFPHTISATMATERVALAVLENNQEADGSVLIPSALKPYMGGIERITPP